MGLAYNVFNSFLSNMADKMPLQNSMLTRNPQR